MPKLQTQTNDWDYDVIQEPYIRNGKPTGYFANVNASTDEVMGIVSDRYGVIRNSDLVAKSETAFDKAGLTNFERKAIVTNGGARFRMIYDFKETNYRIAKKGDNVGLRLVINNSFDRSSLLSFQLGFLRLVCLNGMTSLVSAFSLVGRHTNKLDIDKLITESALDKAMDSVNGQLDVFRNLAKVPVTQEQGLNVIAKIPFAERNLEEVRRIWNSPSYSEDKERNLLNVYNAGTEFLRDYSENRFEKGEELGQRLLRTLDRGIRTKTNIKQLLALPKSQLVKN
jgi:hypothetical protein